MSGLQIEIEIYTHKFRLVYSLIKIPANNSDQFFSFPSSLYSLTLLSNRALKTYANKY